MDKILSVFNKLNIKIRYANTRENLTVPYGIYKRNKDDNIFADDSIFRKRGSVTLELYYQDLKGELELERELEGLLDENRLDYEKSEDVLLEDKETFVVYYDIKEI